jgi:hypothetical protein
MVGPAVRRWPTGIRFDAVAGYDREAGVLTLADGRQVDVPAPVIDGQLMGEGRARGW